MKTRDAAIGHWPQIFEYYGLPPVTGKRHFKGACPLCGKKGKYRCDDLEGRGTFICNCNRGDGWALLTLTQGKDIRMLMDEVDLIIGNQYQGEQTNTPKILSSTSQQRSRVIDLFSRLSPLKGTDGEKYLQSRGIYELPSENIRYCASQKAANGQYQAIWSLATDDKSNLCYLHRTLLDGDKKANVENAKKQKSMQEENVLSHALSVAIRMFPPASTLGIAEGIETALSCKQIYNVNTWSVINAGFMEKFRVPPGVRHLVIFADMDRTSATGLKAAYVCASANLNAKNDLESVIIRWPDRGDFNDVLVDANILVREEIYPKRKAA